uniref:Uncharacterized protein n=1 Tax=Macrostomum lignano TaxID=282301 RepID=A0A1I8FQ56_9PLAT
MSDHRTGDTGRHYQGQESKVHSAFWLFLSATLLTLTTSTETDLLNDFAKVPIDPSAVSSGIQDRLARLKREKIPSVLPAENISRFTVHWSHNGIDPTDAMCRGRHQAYLDSLCLCAEDFENPMDEDAHPREFVSPVSGLRKTSLMAKLAFAMLDRPSPLAADGTDDGSSGPGAFFLIRQNSKPFCREQLRQRDRILLTDKQLRLLETLRSSSGRCRMLYARLCVISLQSGAASRVAVVPESSAKHGVLLVRRALGYLTVSYAGLSGRNELEDILAFG